MSEASSLAARVRSSIKESGISQREIERATGIRQPVLSKFINGGSMKIETLDSLLTYLNMEVQDNASSQRKISEQPVEQYRWDLSEVTGRYSTILIDPPWRFQNRSGKVAPEHKRLRRYRTMSLDEIKALPVPKLADNPSHLYMWCPNALLPEGLDVMRQWGFKYKTNLIWYKTRKDGGPDGRGVGFYFRNVTEILLFGIKGSMRTLAPGRSQVNIIPVRKREHSRKPDEAYKIIEECSPGPFLELFARERVPGWASWGDEVDTYEMNRTLRKGYNDVRHSSDDGNGLRPAAVTLG